MDLHDSKTEDFLNDSLLRILNEKGYKHFALNLVHLQKENYVEFRYVGGIVNQDLILEKLTFFAYITYQMTHEEYKRKEYLKRLYKFTNMINEADPSEIKPIDY